MYTILLSITLISPILAAVLCITSNNFRFSTYILYYLATAIVVGFIISLILLPISYNMTSNEKEVTYQLAPFGVKYFDNINIEDSFSGLYFIPAKSSTSNATFNKIAFNVISKKNCPAIETYDTDKVSFKMNNTINSPQLKIIYTTTPPTLKYWVFYTEIINRVIYEFPSNQRMIN